MHKGKRAGWLSPPSSRAAFSRSGRIVSRMLTGKLARSRRRLPSTVTVPAPHASSHRPPSPASSPTPPNQTVGTSRHSNTPRGLPVTDSATASRSLVDITIRDGTNGWLRPFVSACSSRRSPSPSRRSCSIRSSSRRIGASAADLPVDGSPTIACHRTIGSDHAGVTCTRTPAPQTPATPASTACKT